MPIAVDDTTVARFATGAATAVSAAFTPPDGSLLVCCTNGNTGAGTDSNQTVSGGGLTWTKRVEADNASNGGEGYSAIFTAPVTVGASMTVTVDTPGGANLTSAKVYIVTGQHASPIGASADGLSATNNLSIGYTSTADNSRGFGVATDWNERGLPTSTDTEDAATYSGKVSVMSAYKAADTATSGTGVTINFDAGGASAADWQWCVLEIKPAAGGGGGGASGAELLSPSLMDPGMDLID